MTQFISQSNRGWSTFKVCILYFCILFLYTINLYEFGLISKLKITVNNFAIINGFKQYKSGIIAAHTNLRQCWLSNVNNRCCYFCAFHQNSLGIIDMQICLSSVEYINKAVYQVTLRFYYRCLHGCNLAMLKLYRAGGREFKYQPRTIVERFLSPTGQLVQFSPLDMPFVPKSWIYIELFSLGSNKIQTTLKSWRFWDSVTVVTTGYLCCVAMKRCSVLHRASSCGRNFTEPTTRTGRPRSRAYSRCTLNVYLCSSDCTPQPNDTHTQGVQQVYTERVPL